MERSKHTMTKYLRDEKRQKAIKRFKILARDLYELELVKYTVEHCEPTIIGYFILQYATLSMLELFYQVFDKFCDNNKLEELELNTGYLYLALAEVELDDCILPRKREE